jgi:hypothetical protein
MPISTVSQKGLDAPLTLTSPTLSGTTTATTVTSPAATALTLQSAGTTAVTITTTQNVGIGTTNPGNILELKSATPIQIFNQTTANSNQGIQFQSNGTNYGRMFFNSQTGQFDTRAGLNNGDGYYLTYSTDGSERMRILSDGSILLGTTTQGGATGISFSSASDSALYGKSMYMNSPYNGTRNAISFAYNSAGGVGQIVTGTNSVSYQSGSDYRLKKDIAPMTGALAIVAQLKPVTFKWKSDSSDGQGFIAHEIQAVVPDCATGEKDAVDADGKPVYQGVDTSFLVATLTAAIQELKAEFDAYKASHP